MPSVYFLLPFPSTLQNGVRNKYYCTTVLLLRTSTLPCTYVRDFTVIFLTQDHVPNGWGVSTPTPFIYPRHPWDAITNIIMATRITLFIGQVVYWGGHRVQSICMQCTGHTRMSGILDGDFRPYTASRVVILVLILLLEAVTSATP